MHIDGLTGRLGVGIPPVLDTVGSSCSHNFILDRPVLSIVHDILALQLPTTYLGRLKVANLWLYLSVINQALE